MRMHIINILYQPFCVCVYVCMCVPYLYNYTFVFIDYCNGTQLSETVSPSLIEESSSEGFTAMTSQSTPAGKGKGKLSTKDSPSTSGRQTKSLEILTPKFIDCIFESNGQIDLNDVSTRLGVQKRRIYDMMNILEGIGVVVKSDKMIKMAYLFLFFLSFFLSSPLLLLLLLH